VADRRVAARFEILEVRSLLGWNQQRAARQFLVSDNTISNWERDQSPESKTIGSLAKPIPPVTRLSDAIRHLVQMMARFGFGGAELIASNLALAGFRIAEKTVRNIKREKVVASAGAREADTLRPPNPVLAKFVHQVWMMDVTEFKTLFGAQTLYFAAVFDAFSRLPLAGKTFAAKPGGTAMAGLFKHAVAAFGRPKYLLTDLGGEIHRQGLAADGCATRHKTAVCGGRQHPCDSAPGAILEDPETDRSGSAAATARPCRPGASARSRPHLLRDPSTACGTSRSNPHAGVPERGC
jgi:transcriptional regulator with XRE-family HTH domain